MEKIAHLVYFIEDEIDEYGNAVDTVAKIVRYTNPVINGMFTGHGWFSMPTKISLSKSVQELANEYNEVIFDMTTGEYIFPKKKEVK